MAVAAARGLGVLESFDRAPASEHSVADDESKGRGTRAVPVIRHWEVTARVQKAFLSFFWICLLICLIFLIFLLRSRARPDLAADSGCRRVRRARGRL